MVNLYLKRFQNIMLAVNDVNKYCITRIPMPVLPNQPLQTTATGTGQSFGGQLSSAFIDSLQGSVGLNPMMSRQNVSTMYAYSNRTQGPSVTVNYPQASYDWRVRVSLAPNSNYFYNDATNNLLSPLRTESSNTVTTAVVNEINSIFGGSGQSRIGVVFPYTPSVTIAHTANYEPQKLTHSNYTNYFYNNSEVGPISINADFTVQNINEGQYLLATVYFFRSVTKMFFGNDRWAGNPPPLVYLNGYGEYYLPNVPCVVTSFSHTMPDGVDYVDTPEPGIAYNPSLSRPVLNSTRMPTQSTIALTLQPVYSRLAQSQGFSLQDFARGAMINAQGTGGAASSFGQTQLNQYGGKASNGGFL